MAASNPNTSLKVAPEHEFREDLDSWVSKLTKIAQDPAKMTQQGEIPWSTDFWDCFSPGDLCFKSCCCPCITFGQTHHRLTRDPDLNGYSCCNLACCAWCVAAHCGLHCIPNIIQRNDIKDRGHLTGNIFLDIMKAWCCSCCDLIQQDKEAEHLLSRNNVVSNQPGKVEGMNYGAPQQQTMTYPQQQPQQQQGYPQQQGYQQQPMKG